MGTPTRSITHHQRNLQSYNYNRAPMSSDGNETTEKTSISKAASHGGPNKRNQIGPPPKAGTAPRCDRIIPHPSTVVVRPASSAPPVSLVCFASHRGRAIRASIRTAATTQPFNLLASGHWPQTGRLACPGARAGTRSESTSAAERAVVANNAPAPRAWWRTVPQRRRSASPLSAFLVRAAG